MKKLWNIIQYAFVILCSIVITFCIYRQEVYLAFKGILCLVFWIATILESKHKNKVALIVLWISLILLVLSAIFERVS